MGFTLCRKCGHVDCGHDMKYKTTNDDRRGASDGKRRSHSGWTPRAQGTMSDGIKVTFRQGIGEKEGQTLIANGYKSARAFDREHNHYGDKAEGGRIEDDGGDRGHYTGPNH